MEQAQQLAGVLRDAAARSAAALDGLERLERRRGAPGGDPRRSSRRATGSTAARSRRCSTARSTRCSCSAGRTSTVPWRTGSTAAAPRGNSDREHRRQALIAAVATPSSSRADAASSAGRARGGWISSSSGAGWSASSAPTANQWIVPRPGGEVEVEPQRVDPRALIGGPPARPEVVVDVEDARRGREPARSSGAARSGGGRRRRWRGRCRGRARPRSSRSGGRASGPRAGSPRPSPVPGRPARGSRARA